MYRREQRCKTALSCPAGQHQCARLCEGSICTCYYRKTCSGTGRHLSTLSSTTRIHPTATGVRSPWRKRGPSTGTTSIFRSRWDFRDALYNIDEDSVRRSLDKLLGIMFHNEAISPEPEKLRRNMSKLFYHLANDSLSFFIINSQNDTVPFVLKKNYSDSTALFLVNSKQDTVKVFLKGDGKSDLYMWVNDDFRLTQMLKKKASADLLRKEWESISRMKLPRRKIPPAPPKYWKTGGNIDVSLNQLAFSHWGPRGGTNRVSLLFTSNGFANYKKGKLSWNNSYDYRYGVLKLQGVKLNKNCRGARARARA